MINKESIFEHFQNRWADFYGRLVDLPAHANGSVKICSPLRRDDKNPSFQINFEGEFAGRWRDYGSDLHGDAIDFYQRVRGTQNFNETVEKIAQEFGIQAGNEGEGPKRIKTLAERGILESTANAFQITEGKGNAKVTHRITFPIFDRDGKRIGEKTHKAGQTKGNTAQLYPWKALNHEPAYLVNGEPSVWRSWEAGYRNVLCSTGGEDTFKREWVDDFRGKVVRLALDNDEAGRKGMAKTAGLLFGVAEEVKIVVWPEEFPSKGDVEDWLNLGHRLEDLEFCLWEPKAEAENTTNINVGEWPEPQPLPYTAPPVDGFVPDLLPSVLRPWIADISERMQCPMDFPAVGAIVALSSIVGRQLAIRPKVEDDWTVVPNLWGGVVGRPGLLKTPALAEVLRPVDRLEAQGRGDYEEAQRAFDVDALIREAKIKHAKGEVAKAVRDGRDPSSAVDAASLSGETPPVRRRYRTNDPSMEKLGELLNENPRGLLLFRDELTGFLRTLDREGHESDRAFYLEAWNGTGRFTFDRIGRGTIDIQAACISILGGIQPGPMRSYMSRAARGGQDDDGLVQRFQLCVWPEQPGHWVNVDRAPDLEARRRAYEVFDRLNCIDPVAIGAEVPQEEGDLPYLRFTPEAQVIFIEWRTELEHRLRGDSLAPMMESYLAKYRSLIPSLALLIHLADVGYGPVSEDALTRACGWGDYLESHARRIYAPALSPDIEAAGDLAEHIRRGDLGSEFALREAQQKGWSGLTEREAIKAGLDLLVEIDWLREKTESTGGRPRTRYTVNPKINGGEHGPVA